MVRFMNRGDGQKEADVFFFALRGYKSILPLLLCARAVELSTVAHAARPYFLYTLFFLTGKPSVNFNVSVTRRPHQYLFLNFRRLPTTPSCYEDMYRMMDRHILDGTDTGQVIRKYVVKNTSMYFNGVIPMCYLNIYIIKMFSSTQLTFKV